MKSITSEIYVLSRVTILICVVFVSMDVGSGFHLDPPIDSVWNVSDDMPYRYGERTGFQKPMVSPFDEMEGKGARDVCIDQTGISTNYTGYDYMNEVYEACNAAGEVCVTNMCGKPGPFFRLIEKQWHCPKLWSASVLDMPSTDKHPPTWDKLPQGVRENYHYKSVHVHVHGPKHVYDNKYYGATALVTKWDKKFVDEQVSLAAAGKVHGAYGVWHGKQLREMIKRYSPKAHEKKLRALVVGSETPWVESILLSVGFAHVTTLEYGRINTDHEKLSTYTPSEFAKRVMEGAYSGDKGFDVVVIYSSVEHSGLGRYGDAINPPGDLIMMARVHCVTKPGGLLYFAGPVAGDLDRIHFNGHRIYGPIMLPNLMANWNQLAGPDRIVPTSFVHIRQPVLVMQKPTLKNSGRRRLTRELD